jgi:hypothetical protein
VLRQKLDGDYRLRTLLLSLLYSFPVDVSGTPQHALETETPTVWVITFQVRALQINIQLHRAAGDESADLDVVPPNSLTPWCRPFLQAEWINLVLPSRDAGSLS